MATVNGTMSARIIDSYGIPGQCQVIIAIDDTKTIAQLATDVAEFVADLFPLTQGEIVNAQVRIDLPGGTPGTPEGDIEKGGLFNLNNATDPYVQGVLVPDIAPTVLTGTGLIDLANTDVTAFISYLTTAHLAITVVSKGVRALTTLRDALVTFRKHRKPLARKTKEVG